MSHFKCWLSRAMTVSDVITFDGYEVESWRYISQIGVFNRMLVDLASGEQITLDDREITITDGQADIDRGDHSVEVTFQRLYNLTMEDLR